MELRFWHFFIVFNCVIVIPCLSIKTFSLNEAIAAEARKKQPFGTTDRPRSKGFTGFFSKSRPLKEGVSRKFTTELTAQSSPGENSEESTERFPLNKLIPSNAVTQRRRKATDNLLSQSKLLSPLSNRQRFQIKSPLKPRKLKHQPRFKRKHQATKRNSKYEYIPLLKSVRMLFDNLVDEDTSEPVEEDTAKYRQKKYTNSRNDGPCRCDHGTEYSNANSDQEEETIASAATISAKVSVDPPTEPYTKTAHNTATSNVSGVRKNKILPLLPARNTTSVRRNDRRFSGRSSATIHRSVQGDNTGDSGIDERHTDTEGNETSAENDKQDPVSAARIDANGDRLGRGIFRSRNSTRSKKRRSHDETEAEEFEDTDRGNRRHVDELERENQLEIRRDKTEDPVFIPQSDGRLRQPLPEGKVSDGAESIQSKEVSEKSDVNVAFDNTSDKRITDRGSTATRENQNALPTDETMRAVNNLPVVNASEKPQNKTGVVIIIDGYSVARDKNGDNKLARNAIRILN